MKLQIDTVAKTIKLEQSAKITEIISTVKKLLPNDWRQYSLQAVETIYNWSNPVYIPYVNPFPLWQSQPFEITCSDNTEPMTINGNCQTLYNVSLNN